MSFASLLYMAEQNCVPLSAALELTQHCNHRCPHCYITDFSIPDGMSTERILVLIDELAEAGTLNLTLTGGEMFMRRDWAIIAQTARRRGFNLTMFSNGALINDAVAAEVAELNARVEITLHSLQPEVFDQMAGKRGSFARTMAGIHALRRHGVTLTLKAVLTRDNWDEELALREFAKEVGAKYRSDVRLFARHDGNMEPVAHMAPKPVQLKYFTDSFSGYEDPAGAPEFDRSRPICSAAVRTVSISASGDVRACTSLPESAGNLNEKSFKEIWETSPWFEKVRNIRVADLDVCSTCPKISTCKRCHAQALLEDGNLLGPSSWSCQHAADLEEAFSGAE